MISWLSVCAAVKIGEKIEVQITQTESQAESLLYYMLLHSKTLSFVLPDNFGKKTYGKTMDFFSTSSLLLSSTKLSLKNDLLKIDFEYHSKVNQKK